jgi:hypothetical protein
MIERIVVGFLVVAFQLLIWYSHTIEICKMIWYRASGTKYVKLQDKFHPVYRKI